MDPSPWDQPAHQATRTRLSAGSAAGMSRAFCASRAGRGCGRWEVGLRRKQARPEGPLGTAAAPVVPHVSFRPLCRGSWLVDEDDEDAQDPPRLPAPLARPCPSQARHVDHGTGAAARPGPAAVARPWPPPAGGPGARPRRKPCSDPQCPQGPSTRGLTDTWREGRHAERGCGFLSPASP